MNIQLLASTKPESGFLIINQILFMVCVKKHFSKVVK